MAMDIIELETGWTIVQEGINKMISNLLEGPHKERFSPHDYIMLHSTIYNMCIQLPPHRYSRQLYERYGETLEGYLKCTVISALMEKHDEYMLLELVKRWKNHQIMVHFLSGLFKYLDRFLVPQFSLPTLSEAGLLCFRTFIYTEIKQNVKDVVLAMINKEREGEEIDRSLIKNILDIFVAMGTGSMLYEDFEMPMLLDTASYYSRKGASWIQKDSFPGYVIKVEECLKMEKDRIRNYLHCISEAELLHQVRHQLISTHKQHLLENKDFGLHVLLRDNKVDDLSRMYSLFSQVPTGLETVSTMFEQHVSKEGALVLKQNGNHAPDDKEKLIGTEESQDFIGKAIELHEKYLRHVTESFVNDSMFSKALENTFKMLFNQGQKGDGKNAEALAIFCDNLLKKCGSGKLSEENVEDTFDKVVKLLEYIDDKDLFAEIHRKKLARRVLFDKYSNDEHERSVLNKLKQQFGAPLTYKMERMLTDIVLARENQMLFEEYLKDNALGLDLTMTVLTTGFWPSYKPSSLVLPSEMVKCVETFNTFYQTKTKRRKLTWICSLGSCHIVGKFEAQQIELVVTTYQAAVLLLFNEAERLSYMDIKNQLNLSHDDTMRLLSSLSCGKYKILNKDPETKNVSQSDIFEFNRRFTNKMCRIRIPLPTQEVEKKSVSDAVDIDRRFAVDACIVRIMKSRSVLPYQQLEAQCVEQLHHMFKPNFKFIKKRTEELMDREFLKRNTEHPNMLIYLP